MKKITFLFALLIISSCTKDDFPLGPSANIYITFKANFNGEPLVMGKTYQYPDGKGLRFDEFSFFFAGVALEEAETSYETDLMEVALADFSNGSTLSFPVYAVPAASYRGVNVNFGVPSKFNKKSVLELGVGHPVREAYDTHFWEEGGSFFFLKLAGTYDNNGDGQFTTFPTDHPFEHFTHGNDQFLKMVLDKNFELEGGKDFQLEINFDLAKLYLDPASGQAIDLGDTANLSTHDPENETLNVFFTENIRRAVSVK